MKIKSLFIIASFVVIESLFFISCKKDSASAPIVETPSPTPSPTPTATADPCDTVTYAKHIKPIVDSQCLGCHGDVNPFGGFSLNSYDLLKSKGDAGKLKTRVIDGNPSFMPQGSATGLPKAQKDLFACWIKNGFKK